MDLKRLLRVVLVFALLAVFSGTALAEKKPTARMTAPAPREARSPLSIEHLVGTFTFAQSEPASFVNGYIEFFPDHRWTFVVHFDDDRDRITDRHVVHAGTYAIHRTETALGFVLIEKNRDPEPIEQVVFRDGAVAEFSARGFRFTRRKGDAPYFDHSLNVSETAKHLEIQTEPQGAMVFLDGVRVQGNTPLIIKHPPAGRPIALRIERLGFATHKETIELAANQSKTLSFELISGNAELWIATKPWTRVVFDGHYRGDAPIKLTDLKAGTHTVILENSGAEIRESFEIELAEGQVVKKVFEFTGTLDIFLGRSAEIVNRKGKVIGTAPMQGLKLSVGNHTLRLVSADKKMKILTVKIKLDQTTTVNADWDKLSDFK